MAQQIKMRTRVYSDVTVRDPQRYYDSVFQGYNEYWTLLESDDPKCILVETTAQYDLNPEGLDNLYDLITPEMYQSTYRTYIEV
ncbi:hypothetical protein Syn7803C16_64 [Synechococcus phage ACG-2014f]|uniref:Uncharacterized protein n=1 Tax=Synechococcus phage ACG-2014f TaxID=1493511 RepID=A0A0E3I3L1_9CAUD|nr:hypothetical protein Syn7803C16_64 [Synechococcus phage ACG-2014f]AIX43703.1 hypothetical protein Syn7803C24_64 [Synechococcus phage ACG-2014f]